MAKAYFVDEEKIKFHEDLQDRVYARRRRLKKTQEDMGNAIGKSRQQYALDEKNLFNVKFGEVYDILKEVGIRLEAKSE